MVPSHSATNAHGWLPTFQCNLHWALLHFCFCLGWASALTKNSNSALPVSPWRLVEKTPTQAQTKRACDFDIWHAKATVSQAGGEAFGLKLYLVKQDYVTEVARPVWNYYKQCIQYYLKMTFALHCKTYKIWDTSVPCVFQGQVVSCECLWFI